MLGRAVAELVIGGPLHALDDEEFAGPLGDGTTGDLGCDYGQSAQARITIWELRMIQTLVKNWWLLALCGVLDAIISVI